MPSEGTEVTGRTKDERSRTQDTEHSEGKANPPGKMTPEHTLKYHPSGSAGMPVYNFVPMRGASPAPSLAPPLVREGGGGLGTPWQDPRPGPSMLGETAPETPAPPVY